MNKNNYPQVDELPISQKSINALKKAGFNNIGQLLNVQYLQLLCIQGLGAKSARIIVNTCNEYKEQRSIENMLNNDSLLEKEDTSDFEKKPIVDTNLNNLELSVRAKRVLTTNGYKMLSDIINLDLYTLLNMGGLGRKTALEIFLFCNSHIIVEAPKPLLSDILSDKIINLLEEAQYEGLTISKILYNLPDYNRHLILKSIDDLLNKNAIEYIDYKCYIKHKSILEYASFLPQKDQEYLRLRMQGKTLYEIANAYNITRSRVQQIISKIYKKIISTLKNKGELMEEFFVPVFTKYDCISFLSFINIPLSTIVYLKDNYSMGDKDISDALSDELISLPMKIRIEIYIHSSMLKVDDVYLKPNRTSLFEYVTSKYCREPVTFEEFNSIYNNVLARNNIDNMEYKFDNRTFYNKVLENKSLICDLGKRFRYYDYEKNNVDELIDALDLNQFNNIKISTTKIMNMYPQLMIDFDIRNQYELHNLLKKNLDFKKYSSIEFHKMPIIEFGKFDAREELIKIIKHYSSLTSKELYLILQEQYGYDEGPAYYEMKKINDFYFKGVYTYPEKPISIETIEKLKSILLDDFYYYDEMEKLYKEKFGNDSYDDFSLLSIKKAGFNGYSNYIIRDCYSAKEYFEKVILKNDITRENEFDRYRGISLFHDTFCQSLANYDIIEFEKNQYINIRRLNNLGFSKKDLIEFVDDALSSVDEDKYFNYTYLKFIGKEFPLEKLGFDKYFYDSILTQNKNIKFFKKNGVIVFCKNNNNSINDFFMDIINNKTIIEEDELIKKINEEYGFDQDYKIKATLRETADECGVYFDKILLKYYKNKEDFYEEFK